MNENKNFYDNEYLPKQHKIGKLTGWTGLVVCFAPALVLGFIYHLWPNPAALLTASIAALSSFLIIQIVEPISYYPLVGPVGTYMAFLSGNISNMRIPCASMAQISAGVEPGSQKGSIIAAIGMGVSIIINIAVLTLGVIAGSSILAMLPETVVSALNYVLPALFGALFMQFAVKQKKLSIIMLAISVVLYIGINGGVFDFLPGARNYLGTLVTVFTAIAIGVALDKKTSKKSAV